MWFFSLKKNVKLIISQPHAAVFGGGLWVQFLTLFGEGKKKKSWVGEGQMVGSRSVMDGAGQVSVGDVNDQK